MTRHRRPIPAEIAQVAADSLDAAFEVHTELGPGCLERVYTLALEDVLLERGHRVQREVALPVVFRGKVLTELGYRMDLLVDGSVVIEVKTTDSIAPRHRAQVINYLRLSGCPVGLLLNFSEAHMKDGFDRLAHPDYAFRQEADHLVSGTAGPSGAPGPR